MYLWFSHSTLFFFFFNDTATTEIYTLSLHDALPIWLRHRLAVRVPGRAPPAAGDNRSEEHTSELQSHSDLVCRLLLEKKKNNQHSRIPNTIEYDSKQTEYNTHQP